MKGKPARSSDIKVLTPVGAPNGQEGGGDGDDDNAAAAAAAPVQNTDDVDVGDQREDRKRAASGEADDTAREDDQAASGSASSTLPPPAPLGVNMRDRLAAGHSPETAARNKRNAETLRAQADRRGAKRENEEPMHPEDPRANNIDDPEISLVGAYGTK